MDKIIKIISAELQISEVQVKNTYKLLEAGATIPFISRYRKEVTGGLDEVMIQSIFKRKGELEDIVKNQGELQAECHFCNKKYVFTKEELQKIIDTK